MFVCQFDERLGLIKIGHHHGKGSLLAKFSGPQRRDRLGIASIACQMVSSDSFDRENLSASKQLRRSDNATEAGFARIRSLFNGGQRNSHEFR